MRLTIKLKLGLAFGLLTVLATVMAVMGIMQLASLNTAITLMMNGPFSQARIANDMLDQVNSAMRNEKNLIMNLDPKKIAEYDAKLLAHRAKTVEAREALAKIADHAPDIIFVDIMMPRLDGYQACALIKGNPRFSKTPVIMLSSKDGLFDRARGRMVGSDEYLTKPFTRDELLGAVRAHTQT